MKAIFLFLGLAQFTSVFCQNWIFNEQIISKDNEENDWFGYAVAISDSNLIIGAPFEDDLNSGTSTLSQIGAIYLYKQSSSGKWIQKQKLRPHELKDQAHFGGLIGITDSFVLVSGRPNYDNTVHFLQIRNDTLSYSPVEIVTESGSTINGYTFDFNEDVSDLSVDNNYAAIGTRGIIHIFKYEDNWAKIQEIAVEGFESGSTVSIDLIDDLLIIGSPSSSEGPDNTYLQAGVVFIYKRLLNGNWAKSQEIVASDRDTYDNFGIDVKLYGNKIFVGAMEDEHGLPNSMEIEHSGSAYIFEFDQNTDKWLQKQKVTPTSRNSYERFGIKLDANDSTFAVGSQGERVIVFIKEDGSYIEKQSLKYGSNNGFAESLAINSNNIAIGSPYDDSNGSNSGMIVTFNNKIMSNTNHFNAPIISIYPNPTKQHLYIKLGTLESGTIISITDISGRQVFYKKINNENEVDINFDGFNSGLYFIAVVNGNYKSINKVLLTKE